MRKALIVLIGLLALWVGTVGTIVTPEVVLVDPTADLQTAVDNTPDGGTLQLGTGEWLVGDGAGLVIDHPMILRGASRDDSTGTVIRPYQSDYSDPSGTSIGILVTSPNVTIENLCIANEFQPSDANGGFSGFGVYVTSEFYADTVCCVTLRDLTIRRMGGDGIVADGSSSQIVGLVVDNVYVERCGGNPLIMWDCTGASVLGLYAERNVSNDIDADKDYYSTTLVAH